MPISLHLKYSTLRYHLDSDDDDDKNYNYTRRIVIVKREKITAIYSTCYMLPNDICDIINSYCWKQLYLRAVFLTDIGMLQISLQSSFLFHIRMFNNQPYICNNSPSNAFDEMNSETGVDNKDVEHLQGLHWNAIINAFMESKHNRQNYFDSDSGTVAIYLNNDKFLHTIISHHAETNTVSGIRINNYKRFRYQISILKCIMSGMKRYYSSKK